VLLFFPGNFCPGISSCSVHADIMKKRACIISVFQPRRSQWTQSSSSTLLLEIRYRARSPTRLSLPLLPPRLCNANLPSPQNCVHLETHLLKLLFARSRSRIDLGGQWMPTPTTVTIAENGSSNAIMSSELTRLLSWPPTSALSAATRSWLWSRRSPLLPRPTTSLRPPRFLFGRARLSWRHPRGV